MQSVAWMSLSLCHPGSRGRNPPVPNGSTRGQRPQENRVRLRPQPRWSAAQGKLNHAREGCLAMRRLLNRALLYYLTFFPTAIASVRFRLPRAAYRKRRATASLDRLYMFCAEVAAAERNCFTPAEPPRCTNSAVLTTWPSLD